MALLFTNAISDRVDNNTTDSLDNLTAGSMLAWVYRTTSSADRFVFCKGRTDLSRAKYMKINSSDSGQGAGSVQVGIYRATTPYIVEPTGTTLVPANTWACIAAVWDTAGVAGDQHIYAGSLLSALAEPGAYTTRTVGSGLVADDSADIFVTGNQPVANNLSFAGRIAYLYIWNRVLSLAELQAQQFAPYPTSGCVVAHHYTTTPTVADDSGSNNFGTVTGASLADDVPLKALAISGSPTLNGDSTCNIDSSDFVRAPSSLISSTQSWVAMRISNPLASSAMTGEGAVFGWHSAARDFADIIFLSYRTSSDQWDLRREDTSATLQLLVADTFSADQSITLIGAWTSTQIKISVDGAAFSTQANTETPTGLDGNIDIGRTTDSVPNSYSWNGKFFWVAMGTGTLSDADAATINGFGDTDPDWGDFPSGASISFLWRADDFTYLDSGIAKGPGDKVRSLSWLS